MRDDLLQAMRGAVRGAYEILGELGREGQEAVAFLARENDTGRLVALKLEKEGASEEDVSLTVRRELDASIPARENRCPSCAVAVTGWSRFCLACGHDLSGVASATDLDAERLRLAADRAAGQAYDLLGEMPRAEGGGPVYFARQRDTGEVVALRLDGSPQAGPEEFSLSVTQMLRAMQPDAPTAGLAGATPGGQLGAASPPRRVSEPDAQAKRPLTPTPKPLDEVRDGPGEAVYLCPSCGAVYEAGTWFCPRDGSPLKPRITGPDLVGRIIAGRYRVLRKIGEGGMGQVYQAEHVRIGRPCALKIMNPALKNDPEALGRFGREAAHASKIDHPNVATVHDFGETEDGLIFLAMEYAEGERLTQLIEKEHTLPQRRAADLARQVADAVVAAHELGIVHRDLKPDNVIVARRGSRDVVKVVDFGIAKAMETGQSQKLTRTGYVVGTPRYMSPEQLIGDPVDGRSDIYAIGCILFEMLVGSPAFGGPTGESIITRRLTEPPPSPRKYDRAISRELDEIVVRAMARAPGERFENAIALRDALTAAARPGPVRELRDVAGPVVELGTRARAAGSAVAGVIGSASTALASTAVRSVRAITAFLGSVPWPAWAAAGGVVGIGVLAFFLMRGAGGGSPPGEGDRAGPAALPPPVIGAALIDSVEAPPGVAAGADSTALRMAAETTAVAGAGRAEAGTPARPQRGDPGATRRAPPDSPVTRPAPARQTPQPAREPPTPRETPPVLSRASVDSLQNLLASANRQADAANYNEAFRLFRAVDSRLGALRAQFPSASELAALATELAQTREVARRACEFLRDDDISRGRTPAFTCS